MYDFTTTWQGRNERRRTTVDEEQQDSTLSGTLLVHVVHAQLAEPVHPDGAHEHGSTFSLRLCVRQSYPSFHLLASRLMSVSGEP